MVQKRRKHRECRDEGFSLIEMMIVLAIVTVLTAIAIPQIIGQRRLTRSTTTGSSVVAFVPLKMREQHSPVNTKSI